MYRDDHSHPLSDAFAASLGSTGPQRSNSIMPSPASTITRRASMSRAGSQQSINPLDALIVKPIKTQNAHGFHTPFAPPRTKGLMIGGVLSLYCPQHDVIFGLGGQDVVLSGPLSDEDIVRLHSKYS